MLAYRLAIFFAMARRQIASSSAGTSPWGERGGAGSAERTRASVARADSPRNGCRPLRHS